MQCQSKQDRRSQRYLHRPDSLAKPDCLSTGKCVGISNIPSTCAFSDIDRFFFFSSSSSASSESVRIYVRGVEDPALCTDFSLLIITWVLAPKPSKLRSDDAIQQDTIKGSAHFVREYILPVYNNCSFHYWHDSLSQQTTGPTLFAMQYSRMLLIYASSIHQTL